MNILFASGRALVQDLLVKGGNNVKRRGGYDFFPVQPEGDRGTLVERRDASRTFCHLAGFRALVDAEIEKRLNDE